MSSDPAPLDSGLARPPGILRLAIPSPLRRLFDYLPAADTALDTLQPGLRFRVSFGRRDVIGFLVEVAAHSPVPAGKLKPVRAQLDVEPLLTPHLMALVRWSAEYYRYPLGEALAAFLPVALRKGELAELRHERLWVPVAEAAGADLGRAHRQIALLDVIGRHPRGISDDALQTLGYTSGLIRALYQRGLIEQISREIEQVHPHPGNDLLQEAPLVLNDEQAVAVDAVNGALGQFSAFVLQGITGSGKTEVYLQVIEAVLRRGEQALVLVPEIGLTPQTVGRFRRRFHVPVLMLHSGLSDRERLDGWLMAQRGHAAIVIGTRSAIMTPLLQPGLIVVDEEHDGSFKQQEGFRYSARDLAVMRGRREGVPVILGSATPALETLHNIAEGRYRCLPLRQRAGGARPPRFELLDICNEHLDEGLSADLLAAMHQHLQRKEQVLVFLNRRGFAPTLMCHHCGWLADCPQCDAHMTLHRTPPHLHCHHCDYQAPVSPRCGECGSHDIKPLGVGTERSEAALQRLFPDTPVIRIDRDSTRRKDALATLLAKVQRGEPCILLGTQMLAKGHHFPKVTLVAILDADAGLFSADFRGMEKMAQLIFQVAGRAGREEQPGRVLMQTHHADHPQLHCLIEQGYEAFAEQELPLRRAAQLPPFSYQALLRAEAVAPGRAEAFLSLARTLLERAGVQGVTLLGPIPSPMERRAGRYRAQLLLSSPRRKPLQQWCGWLVQELEENRLANRVRWSLDIDPLDMF